MDLQMHKLQMEKAFKIDFFTDLLWFKQWSLIDNGHSVHKLFKSRELWIPLWFYGYIIRSPRGSLFQLCHYLNLEFDYNYQTTALWVNSWVFKRSFKYQLFAWNFLCLTWHQKENSSSNSGLKAISIDMKSWRRWQT